MIKGGDEIISSVKDKTFFLTCYSWFSLMMRLQVNYCYFFCFLHFCHWIYVTLAIGTSCYIFMQKRSESQWSLHLCHRVRLLKTCLQRESHLIIISLKLFELSSKSTHLSTSPRQPVFPLAHEEATVSWVESHMRYMTYM